MNAIPHLALLAAHQNYREHAIWSDRARKLVQALREARCDLTRDYLQRGLALAQGHIDRLEATLRIEPPAEPERARSTNHYPQGSQSLAMDPGYRSVSGSVG